MVGIGEVMVRAVLTGTVGGVQNWSTSWWLALGFPVPEPTQNSLNDYNEALATAITAPLEDVVGNTMANNTKVDALTCYYYDPNTVRSRLVSTAAPLTMVGVGTGSLPYFTSIVASLRTGIPGRSGRGRNYIPLTVGGVVQGNGQLGVTTAQAISDGWRDVIEALNGVNSRALAANGQLVTVASFTKGAAYPVTSVLVDTIPDTQHRRIDQLTPLASARADVG